jgi:hypothetical protein
MTTIRRFTHLVEETLATPPHRRVAIGWAPNATPRTYRLVRQPAWPVRLAAALLSTLS